MKALTTDQANQLNRNPGNFLGTRVKDLEAGGKLTWYSWDAPDAAGAATILAAYTLGTGVTTTLTSGITQPDFPRALSITGNQATATGNVVITGTNIDGAVITETIVSTGAATVNGTKAFDTITSIVLPARGAASDTISVGTQDALGMPKLMPRNTVLCTFFGGTLEGTAPTMTLDADEIEKCLIDPNSALDASSDLEVLFVDINDVLAG